LLVKHGGHTLSTIQEKFKDKTLSLERDLKELETEICPRYEEMVNRVEAEKTRVKAHYRKLITATDQEGEILHRDISLIVNQQKSEIQDQEYKDLSTLNNTIDETAQKMKELQQNIADVKSILQSNDVTTTMGYKSRNADFRTLPSTAPFKLSSLSPQKGIKDSLRKKNGFSVKVISQHESI
jgi:sugar-specific transcriptional regulator TrmB